MYKIILIVLVVILVLLLLMNKKSSSSSKEGYNSSSKEVHKKEGFDAPDVKIVGADRVCMTPEYQICSSNDTCAQFGGVGEYCNMGDAKNPFNMKAGLQVCTCNVTPEGKINNGAVCTQDDQCKSGICREGLGMFSKQCLSELDAIIESPNNPSLIPPSGEGWNIFYDPKTTGPANKFAEETINSKGEYLVNGSFQPLDTVGKLCTNTMECSEGEACNGDGFCASQLVNFTENDGGYYKFGGKCSETSQCTGNLICAEEDGMSITRGYDQKNTCICPKGMYYEQNGRQCLSFENKERMYGGLPVDGKCKADETYDVPSGMCIWH